MKKTKLSHSAIEKYEACGEMYRLHYIEKLRPTTRGGALVFGSALDDALNELLIPTGRDPEEVFDESFMYTDMGGEDTFIPTCLDLVYSNADFDSDLLLPKDYEAFYNLIKEGVLRVDSIQSDVELVSIYNVLREMKKEYGFQNLIDDERKVFNYINWLSLRRKGHLMIDAYKENVLPLLGKIYAVQKNINLSNTEGDSITGIVDLVAEVKDYGVCILDNKSSSTKYADDSVSKSPQLGLYVHCLEEEYNTRKAGYIVMQKKVKKHRIKTCKTCGHDAGAAKTCNATVQGKRCHGDLNEVIIPEIKIDMYLDEIPKESQDIVIERCDNTNEKIKAGIFERNTSTCYNYFGQRCPYFDKCHNGSEEGLVNMKKEKK